MPETVVASAPTGGDAACAKAPKLAAESSTARPTRSPITESSRAPFTRMNYFLILPTPCDQTKCQEFSPRAVDIRFDGPRALRVRLCADREAQMQRLRFSDTNLISVDPDDSHPDMGDHQHHGHTHRSPHRG
jgi:hypothetical protein